MSCHKQHPLSGLSVPKGAVRLFALAVLPLALALVFAVAPQSARSKPLVTGVSYIDEEGPTSFDRVRRSGVRMVHIWLLWHKVAPAIEPASWDPKNPADQNYDWSWLDQWVSDATEAGLEPVLQIHGTPAWAQGCTTRPGIGVSPAAPCNPAPAKLADFAQAASRRYSGSFGGLPRVKFWQVLNEPNLLLFFGPQFNANGSPAAPSLYRELLAATYPAIKSGNPGNMVIGGGLAPNGVPNYGIAPLDFARRLFCMNRSNKPIRSTNKCRGGVKLDIFDMHPYTSGGPTHKAFGEDNVQMGDLGKLTSVLRAAERANRISGVKSSTPLWITEMSWDSSPPDPGGVPMSILTRWTAEALYRSWKVGVSKFFWFSLRDQAPGDLPWSDTLQSGLYFRGDSIEQDRPKRSLKAFRFPLVAYSKKGKGGVYYWGKTPNSKSGRVVIQFKTGGGWRRIEVGRARAGGVFAAFVKSKAASHKRGFVRAIYRKEKSVPFDLKPVKDFFQRPFG